jgi:imidazolonepropionase-like amidohydrolase
VRIVTGGGTVIDSGTIVVRDGLIAAVGANLQLDDTVWTLDGSGLTAYPGLIDALTTLGLPSDLREPEGRGGGGRFGGGPPGQGGNQDFARGPEDRPATFTWVQAADHLEASDDRMEAFRKAGFTSAVSVPDRGLLPGQASVINLAGDRANDMVIATPVAAMVKFDKGRGFGGFPNSLMGSIAYIKQTFSDARHYEQAWSIYEGSPSGLARPRYDRALEPLKTALRQGRPILMPGVWAREIRRSMAIARDMSVRPIIYGAHQGYAVADELAAAGISSIVSLNWPKRDPDGDPEADEPLQVLRLRDRAPTTPAALHAAGAAFAFTAGGASAANAIDGARLAVRAGLPADAALHAFTLGAAEIFGVADRLGSIEVGKIANLTLTDADLFADGTHVRMVVVDGHRFEFDAPERDGDSADAEAAAEAVAEVAPYEVVPSVTDRGPVSESGTILIRGGTVLPISGDPIENGSVLVRDGRIAAVGTDIEAPAGARIIDATGRYVMPGIIDAHSHIATEAVNEGSVSVSSMVGIEDVIDPDDLGIYRAAAGGVTSINVLHGSANPIGGNNAVLKMRWGANASGLLFEGAPKGIKFALGENTKRDRNPDRYPNSRMGVMDVIRQAFLDAQEYQTQGRLYEQALADGQEGIIPPRRDIKLDALVEILEGTRYVHAHSYRADEILQLLRVAEEFGFQIRTLQHVLEGYRVADEIAEHGAGASTFSDWWAYKVEAYEAIPHNAALMTERGVSVSINSDSGEEMRHLNQEAAKTMRWGGASEADALKMITLNPAQQLGIDDRVGSIEVGKDADLVIFDGHPLSAYGVVQTTIIDGAIYFDRGHDMELREAIAAEKAELMEKQKPAEGEGGERGRSGRRRPTATAQEVSR